MSACADSFKLNSVDYGGSSYKVHIVSGQMPWADFRVHLQPLAQGDGSVSQGATTAALQWKLQCMIAAASASERATLVANVIAALAAAHAAGETAFVLGRLPTRQYMARPVGRVDGEEMLTGAAFDLTIIAPQPGYTTI